MLALIAGLRVVRMNCLTWVYGAFEFLSYDSAWARSGGVFGC